MRGFIRSLLFAVLVVTSIVPALADRGRGGPDARFTTVQDDGWRGRGRGRLVPLEAILANISRSYPGYHIDVDGPYEAGGRLVYRIKWLTPDGHVIIIIADAETGQILSTRGGR
jgi:uncharacterized membrane protein YkoI